MPSFFFCPVFRPGRFFYSIPNATRFCPLVPGIKKKHSGIILNLSQLLPAADHLIECQACQGAHSMNINKLIMMFNIFRTGYSKVSIFIRRYKPQIKIHPAMARNSKAVKAQGKELQELKSQVPPRSNGGSAAASGSKADTKKTDYLVKESRRFGESLIDLFEAEKRRVRKFLDTVKGIESGTYTPRRGGPRANAGIERSN